MKIPIPREHGTWAMLYAPTLCGAVSVGRLDMRFALFVFSVTAAFFLRGPLETWFRLRLMKSNDAPRLTHLATWSAIYFMLAIVSAALLILAYRLWVMSAFAAVFVLMFALHVYWISNRSDRRIPAELAAVLALTSSGPACRYALTGTVDSIAFLLWALNAMFFASSVFYVRMRVSRFAKKHATRNASILSCVYHLLLTAALAVLVGNGVISWIVLLAFLPVLIRAFAGMLAGGKLDLTRIGVSEVAFAVLFVCFMILSFR